jgi:hypothetical protein
MKPPALRLQSPEYVHPSSLVCQVASDFAVGQGTPQSAAQVDGVSPQSHRPLPQPPLLHAEHAPVPVQ